MVPFQAGYVVCHIPSSYFVLLEVVGLAAVVIVLKVDSRGRDNVVDGVAEADAVDERVADRGAGDDGFDEETADVATSDVGVGNFAVESVC